MWHCPPEFARLRRLNIILVEETIRVGLELAERFRVASSETFPRLIVSVRAIGFANVVELGHLDRSGVRKVNATVRPLSSSITVFCGPRVPRRSRVHSLAQRLPLPT